MERLDDVLGYKDLKIYQNSKFFSFSLDSIILANYSTIRLRDKKIVDFCTGNGVVPLILSRRCHTNIIGVEIQDALADLARRSVTYNHLDDRIKIICSDIKDYSLEHLNEFDLVLCNPPYFKVNHNSSFNDSYEKMIARHEVSLSFDELCHCVNRVLKEHGSFCFVHRTDRLIELLSTLKKYQLEVKRIKFIYENLLKSSTLVLIEAQKCGNVGLIVDKPLIQYNLDGTITDEYSLLQREVLK